MHFCTVCSNMYYISIVPDTNNLIYYCKNCGHTDANINETNLSVIELNLKASEQDFTHIINKYTKYDPTLPRVNHILCPNVECRSNSKETSMGSDDKTDGNKKSEDSDRAAPREILYIRYDNINMKYIYMCCLCDTYWKNEERK